uniref:AlNc14C54G4144 protein n=1 Tax=Albugo laibachii Nc14 TaxID=890382 RepID=F0WBV4_9STRA|nr:AlNc14C54G4144 [Albugo laibachii Nc14]|eukprot:CCA18632.1 AlNc14C54G4144 [Albugo laibachii Nc14]
MRKRVFGIWKFQSDPRACLSQQYTPSRLFECSSCSIAFLLRKKDTFSGSKCKLPAITEEYMQFNGSRLNRGPFGASDCQFSPVLYGAFVYKYRLQRGQYSSLFVKIELTNFIKLSCTITTVLPF